MGRSTIARRANRRCRTRSRVLPTSAPSGITPVSESVSRPGSGLDASPESSSVGAPRRGGEVIAERRGSLSAHPWWVGWSAGLNTRPLGSTFRRGVGFATRSPSARRPSLPDGSMLRPGVNGLRRHRRQCALHYVSQASHKYRHLGNVFLKSCCPIDARWQPPAASLRLSVVHGGLHRCLVRTRRCPPRAGRGAASGERPSLCFRSQRCAAFGRCAGTKRPGS